jgi:ABC-type taurine transport system substrate-binding protein
MTDYKATPEQWAQCEDWVRSSVVGASDACILELRTRVETLEAAAHKHIVETNSDIVALFTRVESLEAAEHEISKVHQISKPLKLTPEQEQQVRDLLAPNSKPTPNPSQIRSSLVERVQGAIHDVEFPHGNDEARAVIREVAAWMTSNPDVYFPPALVFALEQEVER